jgi:peptidoglycan hydrolase-like protein with peptidoglycan-binding domain
VTPVSYLRTAARPSGPRFSAGRWLSAPRRGGGRGPYLLAATIVVVLVLGGGAIALTSSSAKLTADSSALASVSMPLGGGTIESVSATTGPHARLVPVYVRDGKVWPRGLLPAHELISLEVVVTHPGWNSWVTGSREHLKLNVLTPFTSLREHYLTVAPGKPLRLEFNPAVQMVTYGPPGHLTRHILPAPQTVVMLPRTADAGTLQIAAAPRVWETAGLAFVSWFPTGGAASAVASPSPGTTITSTTPITLTFSTSVDKALGSSRPPVSPTTAGTWHTVNTHTIVFQPEGYGYGLGATVDVGLPTGVRLVGAQQTGTSNDGKWTVPAGSTLRLQQLLAQLGYLPLDWTPAGGPIPATAGAQEAAAVNPPQGSFNWRYPNTPSALRGFWKEGVSGVVTRGALMRFQDDHGLTTDGSPGPDVWRSLIAASVAGKRSTFGYTFVMVSVSGQKLTLWHSGHTVVTTDVNTGIASAPTATGTYPVFEHIASGTMSGTNPDGSHYSDPGIQWISYFNGGDALHAFTRAQYGFPQSLGCVEMALGPAGQVWPYTPIGTLVHVA